MDEKFYAAAIPEPYTILGCRLRPFSLGHLFILNRIESPFVVGSDTPDIGDFLTAILFCSNTYADGLALLDDDTMIAKVYAWGQELTGSDTWKVRLGIRDPATIEWAKKAAMFCDYMADGAETPTIHFAEDGARSINAPTPQIVKLTLMMRLGISESEIMDRPWSICLWDFCTLKAMDGQAEIVDSESAMESQELANKLFERLNPKTN